MAGENTAMPRGASGFAPSPAAASLPVVCSERWRSHLMAQCETPRGRRSKRKRSWLLVPKEEGWQMCAKELSETKARGTEKMKATFTWQISAVASYPAFVLTVEFLAEMVLHLKTASLIVKASSWICCTWF